MAGCELTGKLAALGLAVVLAGPVPASAQGSFGALEEPSGQASSGARRALLIGIDSYDDPALTGLKFARRDAEYLGEVLADSRYGGFSVQLLVEGDLTTRGLVRQLNQWKDSLSPNDTALLYYSGHGMRWLDERNRSQVFLAGSDSQKDDPLSSALPLAAVRNFLETLPTAKRVLVLDACFTGTGKILAEEAQSVARAYQDGVLPFSERASEHEAHLYATSFGRPALESRRLGHGVYTYQLAQALSVRFDDADINGDLVVSVSEAHDYARARTMETTSGIQVPMAIYKVVGLELLLLSGESGSRRRVAMAMVSAYSSPQQGLRMIVDGKERGAFPSTVLVEPGSRRVEFRNLAGRVVDRGRFEFRREQVYSVSRIRDVLNGGRHQVSLGYAHFWLPGEGYLSAEVPTASGLRIGYAFRFPTREPLLRRMGIVLDLDLGFFPQQPNISTGLSGAPPTTLLAVGIGPLLRLDVPWVALSIQPRFALVNLFRAKVEQPYLNWAFGAVGGNFCLGFRAHNRFSIQAQYSPMLFNVPLGGGIVPRIELMHRLVATIEFGF